MVVLAYKPLHNIISIHTHSPSPSLPSPGDGAMKSSIPVMIERPSRHAALLSVPAPLQIQSVGVASKLESSGGFTRNRRTIHPHTGARRRQQELTSSATHEMHLPPREVWGSSQLLE